MISPQALARLKASDLSTEKIAGIFLSLAELLALQPQAENVSYAVGYSRDDEIQPGEAIPLINFVLARHMPTELNSEDE
jgi:hypothetical protein